MLETKQLTVFTNLIHDIPGIHDGTCRGHSSAIDILRFEFFALVVSSVSSNVTNSHVRKTNNSDGINTGHSRFIDELV